MEKICTKFDILFKRYKHHSIYTEDFSCFFLKYCFSKIGVGFLYSKYVFIIRKDFKSKRREKNYKNCTLNENTRKFEIINKIKNPITNRIFETILIALSLY